MTGKAPSTLGQQFYNDSENVGSSYQIPEDRNVNDISEQTGEEFSSEFLRERGALRRILVMNDMDQHQAKQVSVNFNQNYQPVYEDLTGIIGLRRMDSECNSELAEFVPGIGYVSEVENRDSSNNISRYHRECGTIGQLSDKFAREINSDRVPPGSAAPSIYVVDSPQSCHPHGPGLLENSFSGKMKILCSLGGRILPRPGDGKLRYVGGETRIISIRKNTPWDQLMRKTYAICSQPHTIKYQLPGEDLDALISVCSDEDLHHMIEEYQELERTEGSQRLRIFLISSNEPKSPSATEARANLPNDADYHYVVAVNGMLDCSPRKSPCGQSLASQTSLFGNTSEYSPSFHRVPPTSAYALDVKDCSPRASKFAGIISRPVPQISIPRQLSGKSLNQSPPLSPVQVQHNDPKNSNLQLYVDHPCNYGNESMTPFTMENIPCDNSVYIDNGNYADAMGFYNNLPHGPPIMNYHQRNKYLIETDQTKKPCEVHFHDQSPSEIFISSAACGKGDIISEIPMLLKERNLPSDKIISHPEGPPGLFSESNDRHGSHCKMVHALSDSLLLENDERFTCQLEGEVIPLFSSNTGREKSPSVEMLSSLKEWPFKWEEITSGKQGVVRNENQLTSTATDICPEDLDICQESFHHKNNAHFDHTRRQCEGNDESLSHYNDLENKKLQNINYLPSVCLSSPDIQTCGGNNPSSPISPFESREDIWVQTHGFQFDTTASEYFIKSQSSTRNNQYALSDTGNSIPLTSGSLVLLPVASLADPEQMLQISTSATATSGREVCIHHEDPENCPDDRDKKTVITRHSCNEYKFGDMFCVQSQPFDNCDENKVLEPADLVEDLTDSDSSSFIPPSSKIVPHVDDEVSDESPSSEKEEDSSVTPESESEVARDDDRDKHKTISDAAIAEIEAGIYGLQIIKNADLEELQELGSGTFGTVYHGKWRGTDVAIKRIKKSCFSGKSSEQERLTQDFWREAQILSTLHHPNVVAFYGVVPDGPGGTLATVTEYMVNGSLRNVLLGKDRVLDRRRRFTIAMDAAFGMEYLHLKNIVHFDLKSDNLLVNLRDPERPICKVGDFGLSRIKRNTLISGGVRGTLPWMAPELLNCNSSRVSEKVDVFSFGIAMWEILTGAEPYSNMHCGAIIGGIVNNTLRPSIPKRCDVAWRKLMEECWSPDPVDRPSFTEITNRLRNMSMALHNKRPNFANR
ncbi:Serine/threonine-protein kinase EDR1 [Quillaja saponaria]|uniref:Serine/threonine-protein kinase EDR1 n=1 Tax=Quillaja saponaria TaxID=32244 RepID=A0AAD7QDZ8_QUISA|nr:Serine/threonine-protein kinase EDR1 [Quillaja saponaria]